MWLPKVTGLLVQMLYNAHESQHLCMGYLVHVDVAKNLKDKFVWKPISNYLFYCRWFV